MAIQTQSSMNPLDVVVLLKLLIHQEQSVSQMGLAKDLFISQSEISKSLRRSRYAGLVIGDYQVMALALLDFIQYGIKYAFPTQPGALVRGIPTAHSVEPLIWEIDAEELFVWPSGKGTERGRSIVPLYPSVVNAVQLDHKLHQCLAMVDAVRVGKARERQMAMDFLRIELS